MLVIDSLFSSIVPILNDSSLSDTDSEAATLKSDANGNQRGQPLRANLLAGKPGGSG